MARPRDDQKRHDLAEAAFELVRQRGVATLSMREVADGLGIKRSSLYWYFKDLDAIFETVLVRILEDHDRFLEAALADVEHPVDRLYAHAQAVHDFYEQRTGDIVVLLSLWVQAGQKDPIVALDLARRYVKARRDRLFDSFKEGIARGEVEACDPDVVMRFVTTIVDGLLVQRMLSPADQQPLLAMLWEKILQPLRRPPRDRPVVVAATAKPQARA